MIEIARNYPTLELVERMAEVLEIEIYELFVADPTPKNAMEQLHDTLVGNIEKIVGDAIRDAIMVQNKSSKTKKTDTKTFRNNRH